MNKYTIFIFGAGLVISSFFLASKVGATELLIRVQEHPTHGYSPKIYQGKSMFSHRAYFRKGAVRSTSGNSKNYKYYLDRERSITSQRRFNRSRDKIYIDWLLNTGQAAMIYNTTEVNQEISKVRNELEAVKKELATSIKQNKILIKALKLALTKTIDDIPEIVVTNPKVVKVLKTQLQE